MKKLLSLLSALAMCTAFASCSSKNNSSDTGTGSDGSVFTAEKLSDAAYKKSSVSIDDSINIIYGMRPFSGGEKNFILGSGTKSPHFWVTDRNITKFDEVEFPDFRCGKSYDYAVTDDGTLIVFLVDVDYGDLPAPDPTSADYDEAKYDAAAVYSFTIMSFSPDGKLLSENTVTDFEKDAAKDDSIQGVYSDGKTVVANLNGVCEAFSLDGKYLGTPGNEDGLTIENFGTNSSGELVCVVREDSDTVRIYKVNEDATLEAFDTEYKLSETIYGTITPGSGDYSMFLRSMSTIYGIKTEDSSIEPLFNINKTGLPSSNISGFAIDDEGNFMILTTNYSEWNSTIKKFTPCDPKELENIPVLRVGITSSHDYEINGILDSFRDEYGDVEFELVQFQNTQVDDSGYSEPLTEEDMADYIQKWIEAQKKDKKAIQDAALNGELPDIILTTNMYSAINDFDLAGAGALYDLYDLMEEDESFDKDNIFPKVTELMDYRFDGHAYVMPTSFGVRMPYTAKTKFVGDIEKWDMETYFDIESGKKKIEGLNVDEEAANNRDRRRCILDWMDFIDFKNAECNFDCDIFKRYLNYCSEVPAPNYDEYETQEPPSEEDDRIQTTRQLREYIDDNGLFYEPYVYNYEGYLKQVKGTFGCEDVTTLGEVDGEMYKSYITPGWQYSMCIPKCSENKELAWELTKYLISDEFYSKYYKRNTSFQGFPATKSGMKMIAERAKEPYEYDEYENEILKGYTGVIYWTGYDENGKEDYLKLGEVTDEVINEVNELINSALPSYGDIDSELDDSEKRNDLYNMYYEEIDRFFGGECSADDCARILQDRISTFLSEKYT